MTLPQPWPKRCPPPPKGSGICHHTPQDLNASFSGWEFVIPTPKLSVPCPNPAREIPFLGLKLSFTPPPVPLFPVASAIHPESRNVPSLPPDPLCSRRVSPIRPAFPHSFYIFKPFYLRRRAIHLLETHPQKSPVSILPPLFAVSFPSGRLSLARSRFFSAKVSSRLPLLHVLTSSPHAHFTGLRCSSMTTSFFLREDS